MQTILANNRQTRRRIHIRPNLTIMKGTMADLKFIRYGDTVIPIIMGKERRRIINQIVPQGLNQYVNDLLTVSNSSQSNETTINGWGSTPGNAIQLLNNGSEVQVLNAIVIPVLNGNTVIWVFIASDLSSASYTANQINLFASVNYVFSGASAVQYSPAFNLATATASIVKQLGESISFVWEIQLNLGSTALTDFVYGILYSIPAVETSCAGYAVTLGTFGGVMTLGYGRPYNFTNIQLQYIGGSSSVSISSITTSYDGTNTYLVMSASITLSSQVTASSIVVNVGTSEFFCIGGQELSSGSIIQIPYNATVPSGTINITVTIEFSPAT